MEMVVLFLVLIVFAVAVPRYGVDSRSPSGGPRVTPAADLAALRRLLPALRRPGRGSGPAAG